MNYKNHMRAYAGQTIIAFEWSKAVNGQANTM